MKTLAYALRKVDPESKLGSLVKAAQSYKEPISSGTTDDFLRAHENLLERAARVGLPGFAATSDLAFPPGSQALHGEKPCVVKAHLQDVQDPEQVLVIIRYEHKWPCSYVPGRKSAWNFVERQELSPWQPRRPQPVRATK